MNVKRVLTAIVGLPAVALVVIFGNEYIMDVLISIVAMFSMYEYIKCVENKGIKPIKWICYLSTLLIMFLHVIPFESCGKYIAMLGIPSILLILNLHVIITNMKITFEDITYTLMGIAYLICFTLFIPLIYGEKNAKFDGRVLLGFVFIASWATDIFAYLVGKNFGKTKFSKVSPNKSIEGCIGGTLGAMIIGLLYYVAVLKFNAEIISVSNCVIVGIIIFALSIIGQIGDFSASVIKRHFEIKDFSNLFPGHGGMIDRIDSVIYIAPFAYILFLLCL